MRPTHYAPCLAILVLVACGRDEERPRTKEATSPVHAPTSTTPASTSPEARDSTRWTGTIEAVGPSIVMQGTHKLIADGMPVVYLKSSKVDLVRYEGKKVSVKGSAAPTVEGNRVIVEVEEIEEIR